MTGTFIPRSDMHRAKQRRSRTGDQTSFVPPPGRATSFRRALRALGITRDDLGRMLDDDRCVAELERHDLPTSAPDHLVEGIRRMASGREA
ncbi:MAG: hypothetical protein IT200_04475 [Thermoleophilia bacterium]|nr:hypothetical protein [Thermoleophilia bacterium]